MQQQNRVAPFIDHVDDGTIHLAPSLRPILFLMRIIGIELDQQKMTGARRNVALSFALLMLLLHVATNLPSTVNFLKYWSIGDTLNTSWGTDIDYFQSTWTNIGIHFTMLAVAICRWTSLWNCFDRMQSSVGHSEAPYKQIARVPFIGIAIMITVI